MFKNWFKILKMVENIKNGEKFQKWFKILKMVQNIKNSEKW